MGANSSTSGNQNELNYKKGYTIKGAIGCGAFGKVYKVKNKTTKQLFAIKETPYLGEEGYDRAIKEVENIAALNHVNVVKFNEYFVDRKANKLFITLELCDFNLSEWFRSNMENRSYSEAIRMFREIACGIQYIHDYSIIHRNLKPANVLIKNNVCKIADFGFAVEGIPLYASPEQLNGLWCDKITDIYPLGLIFFEFFMKFDNDYEFLLIMLMIKHVNRVIPERFFERFPHKFEEAKQLLIQMIEFVPSKRPTIQEVLNHPFFLTNANQWAENETTTQQSNDKAVDDKQGNILHFDDKEWVIVDLETTVSEDSGYYSNKHESTDDLIEENSI